MARVLIVEDERAALRNLEHVMKKEGHEVTGTTSGPRGLQILNDQEFDMVLTDLKMEKVDGFDILEKTKALYPDTEVIMITAYATISGAVESMKKGAYHYIAKPFKLDEVRQVVRDALERVRLRRENTHLRAQLEKYEGKVKIITKDPQTLAILETARQVAPTDCNVIITGESGTGKELMARYIHYQSKRAGGPFVAVNCGALGEDLLANELFGHERGAYTGADSLKKGLIETAAGGTLLLDEVTEMSPAMQVKLLRVIQEKELLRIGGTVPVPVNVRFLASTNREIQKLIGQGKFRQDLYFRLNVVTLRLPALSERPGDIVLLAYHFLSHHAALMSKPVTEISPGVLKLLQAYQYPGNIRELENIIERGIALCAGDTLDEAHLPDDLRHLNIRTFRRTDDQIPSLEEQERNFILWVLKEAGGNRTQAAQTLGIDRTSLWRKLKKYGIEDDERTA
jgi:DNA-binding NtrC family response regulator